MRTLSGLLLAGLLQLSSSAYAQQESSAETKRLLAEGQKYFEAGDCQKAYPILQEAYEQSHQPGLLTSIAQCAEFLKENQEALAAYCAYQSIEPNSAYKETIQQSLQELSKSTGRGCPAESKYLPKERSTTTPATEPKPQQKLTVPASLAAFGAIFGAAAIGVRVQAKLSGELPKERKRLGLAMALASDLSFIGAGATLYLALKAPEKSPQAGLPQETSVLVSLQLPWPYTSALPKSPTSW